MTVSNRHIAEAVRRYLLSHATEGEALAPLIAALQEDKDVVSRSVLPIHVSCSAAVKNEVGQILVIRHRRLDRWLLPGGHLEDADTSLLGGALRELREETGISQRDIKEEEEEDVPGSAAGDDVPIDIDLHRIPAAGTTRGEVAHWHADFRYAVRVAGPMVRINPDEITAYQWCPVADLPMKRLASKVRG